MQRLLISIAVALCATLTTQAQGFLQHLRMNETGQGRVSVIQSAEIDSLVNGTGISADQTVTESEVNADDAIAGGGEDAEAKPTVKKPEPTVRKVEARRNPTDDASTTTDNRKKVLRNATKTKGYRIQVYSGGNTKVDKQKAEAAGAAMKGSFPSEPVYVHFYSPSWKCRMGNYVDINDARRALARVKAMGYSQAVIVQGMISVQR